MRQRLVIGNWKMHGRIDPITLLLQELLDLFPGELHATCAVLPPAIYVPMVRDMLQGSMIAWGAQNVYPDVSGAFTGEVSGPMLRDFDCSYVLVGHSERRHIFHEDLNFITKKFHHVKESGMIPVLCVGETLKEREQGLTEEVLAHQLLAVTERGDNVFARCVIAYEPVWAIGTGQTATPEMAEAAHEFIRDVIARVSPEDALTTPILYGGSVNEKNAGAIFAMPNVDGGLVGGASLHARQFLEILKCINCY